MKTDLGKWNPFKFLRRPAAEKPSSDEPSNVPVPPHRASEWPDVSRLFSGEPWRAMLPDGLDLDHVDARFERGLLTVRLPKSGSPQAAVRRIDVK